MGFILATLLIIGGFMVHWMLGLIVLIFILYINE